jgi:hypothetical protein
MGHGQMGMRINENHACFLSFILVSYAHHIGYQPHENI